MMKNIVNAPLPSKSITSRLLFGLGGVILGALLCYGVLYFAPKNPELKVALLPRSLLVASYLENQAISNPEQVRKIAQQFDEKVLPVVAQYERDGYLIVDSYRQGDAYVIAHLPTNTVDLTAQIIPLLKQVPKRTDPSGQPNLN